MAAAVGPSQANSTDNSVKTDQPPKSYREAVRGETVSASSSSSNPEASSVTGKPDAVPKPDSEDTKTKSAGACPKDKNGQDKNGQDKTGQEKVSEKEKDKSADKASSVKKFDNKVYVEAPPPKTNPWKKPSVTIVSEPSVVPPQAKQLPVTDGKRHFYVHYQKAQVNYQVEKAQQLFYN